MGPSSGVPAMRFDRIQLLLSTRKRTHSTYTN
jgi:hypothetical protein